MAWYDNPNNPISGLLAPVATHLQETQKTDQAQRMLMGKYLLDQRASEGTRRFETLNANIKGYEDRRKDLETHKWNLLSSLIDPSSNQPLVGSARTQALTALGFKEDSFKIMMDAMDQDLKSLDRVLNQSYQLRNEMYGFGRAQGIQNTYAGGGYGAGQQGGDPVAAFLSQQGGQPTEATAATVGTSLTGQEQGGQGWMANVGEMAQLTGGSIRDLAVGYWKSANDPNNWLNKLYEEGILNPTDKRNWANEVYEKTLKLLPGDATPEQIQNFWLAPGLHERLVEVIKAGESDYKSSKKSLDLWISEQISPFDEYFKKVGVFIDWGKKKISDLSEDSGLSEVLRKGNLFLADQIDKIVPPGRRSEKAPLTTALSEDEKRAQWKPSHFADRYALRRDPVTGEWRGTDPMGFSRGPEHGFSVRAPDQHILSDELSAIAEDEMMFARDASKEGVPYQAIDVTQPTIPSGNLSGVPSPDYFGTGQLPVQDRMSQWQQFVTDMGLPWDPSAVPTGVEDSFSDLGLKAYQRNLQNLFYEGSQMGVSPPQSPMASGEWYIDSEISVVPTYEVFQQRIQGTPGDPGFYGAPVATGTSTDMAPATAQQTQDFWLAPESVAQGTPGDPNLQGNVGLDTSVTSPLFQDPMGGGVGQPTMNQQTVPMAPMGGTEGVMSAVDEGAMNPYITPGQPQGGVVPEPFGYADMDTWYQPAMDIGGPSGDPFAEDDVLAAGDVGGPGRMILTSEEREASNKRALKEAASKVGTFVGDTWDDFTEWASEISPAIPIGATAVGSAAYWTGAKIREAAFAFFNDTLKEDNLASIQKDARTVERLESQERQMRKDGEGPLDKDDKEALRKARNRLRNHKSMAWKKYLIHMGKKGTPWAIGAAALLYGITEAIGAERTEKLLSDALDGKQEAQFAIDSILKLNPAEVVREMHQQPQGITTIRKERHSGPETHKAPGMLGAPGGMILNYPESAFPRSGLNSGAPQVQAMLSELEKKNQ